MKPPRPTYATIERLSRRYRMYGVAGDTAAALATFRRLKAAVCLSLYRRGLCQRTGCM